MATAATETGHARPQDVAAIETIVESVATIPGADATEVWLLVRRPINGATKRYVERLSPQFEDMDIDDVSSLIKDQAGTPQGSSPSSLDQPPLHRPILPFALQAGQLIMVDLPWRKGSIGRKTLICWIARNRHVPFRLVPATATQ